MSVEPTPKRYVVTGCAGFIGACVSRKLLAAGHQVVGFDDLNSAYDPRMKAWRLAALRRSSAFHFHQLDITDRHLVADFFRAGSAHPFDAVFHLAARAGVRASVDDPAAYLETNVTGTLHVLDACRLHRVPKLVLASTSAVYGSDTPSPFREDSQASRPLSPYAASKKAAEALAYSYHALYGLDVSVLRYFTVYGPAGRPDMSIFRFVRQIAEGDTLVVYGDGSQRRDFTYVEDIARGTIAAAKPLGYEVMNLGGDHPTALSELIRLIAEHLGQEARIDYRPAHAADVLHSSADIRRADELLDWRPTVSLEEGIAATIDWYRQNRELATQISL
ncbi:MAG TPA: SDR family NAD(P)-dependent oxidoreductase [Pirellulales bacterium]|nr:SDR family NAD(P)-dependent oxidoreductase [Pirellulales bacterium]